jgi:hypothetical protein
MVKYANPKTKKEIFDSLKYLYQRREKLGKTDFNKKYGEVFRKIENLAKTLIAKNRKKMNDEIDRNSKEEADLNKVKKQFISILNLDIKGQGNWFSEPIEAQKVRNKMYKADSIQKLIKIAKSNNIDDYDIIDMINRGVFKSPYYDAKDKNSKIHKYLKENKITV